MLRQSNGGDSGTKDASLFVGDLCDRIAKKFLMVQVDVGDHRDDGFDDIGCVQSSTDTDFQHRDLDLGSGKIFEGHGGHGLKNSADAAAPNS